MVWCPAIFELDASVYLEACTTIEKRYTADCGAKDTCLESGCALEGDVCLQPLLRAGPEYHKACQAGTLARSDQKK